MKTQLNPSEKEMFLAQAGDPESSKFCVLFALRFPDVEADVLASAFEKVSVATPTLRSHYELEDGVPVRVDDGAVPAVEIRDASDFAAVKAALAELPHQRDLSVTPVKVVVFRLADESVLGLSMHHITFDGASSILLKKSVESVLAGGEPLVQPTDNLLPAPPESATALYDEMFSAGVPVCEMPTKVARTKEHPFEDRELTVVWTPDEFAALVDAAHRLSVTAFELVFSAVGAVVAKYCGCEDVVLGTQINSRDAAHKDAIGMFVNTGVVRLRPVRTDSFCDYVKASAALVRRVNHGEALPFSDVLSRYGVQTDPSRNPMFDVAVNWLPPQPERLYRVPSRDSGAEKRARDLTLTFTRTKTNLTLLVSWPDALFDETLVANFAAQLKATLAYAARPESAPYHVGRDRTPGDPLSVRDVLALPDDQREALAKFSETASAAPTETLLHKMFEKAAQANPSKIALVAVDRTLTFAELDAEADRVAANLQARGVEKGDAVVLLLPRQSCFFSAMFGVLKAGATFIPCDPKYPSNRINAIISDADAKFIVTTADQIGEYPEGKAIDVETLRLGGAAGVRALPVDSGVTGEDLAYMIYTSGSTGRPKGVMLRHAGICNYLRAHPANIHMDFIAREVTAYVSVTTVSFDMSFKEHCAALVNGKTLVFAGDDQMNDPEELAKLIRVNKADAINATPSRLLQYLECAAFREALKDMKAVLSGGEGYPIALRDLLKKVTKAKIINTYGPTEITVSSNGADITDAKYITIGRPLLNYHEWIVDRFGDLAPFGVTGELYIGGIGVAKGYRNLPEQTAARFVEYLPESFNLSTFQPFNLSTPIRVYRSGDLARWDADGNVLVFGRIDSQVKLRGLRIELGEIEGLLAAQPGVRGAAVVVRKLDGQENLCAYYVADRKIDPAALRDELKKSLTPYMVPTAYLQLDRFPVTPNGKTDLKALPDAVRLVEDMTQPETECQKRIFDVVAEVVGHRDFGIRTSFTSAGLSSLGAVRLSVALGKALGFPFAIRDILSNDTVVKLEGHLALAALAAFRAVSSETGSGRRKDYPITKTQMGVFIECQGNPGTTTYNIPRLVKLGDGVDTDRLVTALKAAVDAHPYLKTHLAQNADGEVRALRRDDAETKVEVVNGQLPEPQSLVKPFNLLGDDLYRIVVYRTSGSNYLFLDFHHIVSDGESNAIFFRDVNRSYAGESLERETYTGYETALDEESALKTDAFDRAKRYYDSVFGGCEPDSLPPYVIEDAVPGVRFEDLSCTLDAARVAEYCKANGVSENAFFNAAFGLTLAKYAGRTDAVFTTIYNGRGDSRMASSVSMLVKTMPVLVDLKVGDGTVSGLVRRTKDQLLESMANDIFSFADVSKAYGVRADAMFAYQSGDFGTASLGGEPVETVPIALDTAKSALSVELAPVGNGYRLSVEFDTGVYSDAFVHGFCESMQAVADAFMTRKTLNEIGLTTASQRTAWDRYNATESPYDKTKTLVERIRERAAEHPDRTALVYLENRYTYGELDRMTDRIAAELVRRGAGRNRMVGILVPRTEWIAILSLAVLKTRSGYLPMDTSYPDERLNLMLKDSGTVILITTPELSARIAAEFAGERILLDDLKAASAALVPHPPSLIPPAPDDLFIMLYTSGTTGVPKGTVIDHSNMIAFSEEHRKITRITEKTVWASFASFGFDTCLSDIFPTFAFGGELHILPEDLRLDLEWVRDYFNRNGVTHTDMTTQVGRQFAILGGTKTLELLNVGGEKLVPLDPPPYRMINCYGPSECTCYISTYELDRKHKEVPIGRPLGNAKFYVCDPNGRLLPPNAVGELWIAGPQVARGYLNRPEKTADVFVANPFGEGRVYKTGDIVALRDDGQLMFVGRRDGQVKVRGFRIELTEVEEVIRRFPGVKDATVQAFDDPKGNGKFVAAYVVADGQLDVRALNDFIRAEKPPYMVPAVTMQIEKIPLNQNSKVNRRALPKPEVQRIEEYVAPETDAERAFCEAFGGILGIERVSATDDFFEIGGSSITAIALMAKAGAAGYPVTYANIFALRTPRALAELAGGGKAVAKEASNPLGVDFGVYDRAAIGRLLEENTLDSFRVGERLEIGDALFTGATGFMGIHLLARFLDTEKGRAYCLVRKGKFSSAERRLKNLFHYYFEERYDEVLSARVEVFDGDVTDPSSFDQLLSLKIDTVFNCAANVKHFSSGTDIEDVNIGGAKAVIGYCLKSGARLVHFSTVSVHGYVRAKDGRPTLTFDERTAFAGQKLASKYTASKMVAELEVFKAVLEKGLRAKVIRLGLLSPRERDGEFQINFRTNAFMGTLRAYATLGCYPYSRLDEPVPTDPIDIGAEAYLRLASTPEKCRLFHATNYDTVPMGSIIRMMNAAGVKVDLVEDGEYEARLDRALEDPSNARVFQPLLAYRGSQGDDSLVMADFVNGYTTQVLARLGHLWKAIGEDYIENFVKSIRDLGFFG